MSLDEGAMSGSVPGDGPIDAGFLKSIGFKESVHWPGWLYLVANDTYLWWREDRGMVWTVRTMEPVNTRQRVIHLLQALEFEVEE